jgi:hypothetical protein
MNITVFCGASIGNNELYKKKTIELAEWIANNNHTLVYEGGNGLTSRYRFKKF